MGFRLVLVTVGNRDPIIKLSLMKTYCSSFYGTVLWDLTNASVRDVCVVWRKELRRTWDLPHNTHCNLLPLLCDVTCCHLWTSWVVGAQNLLRPHLIVTTMLSVMLHDMAFISVWCCRRLAKMHISAARYMMFCYTVWHSALCDLDMPRLRKTFTYLLTLHLLIFLICQLLRCALFTC